MVSVIYKLKIVKIIFLLIISLVPSANKKDIRSIEETQRDIQAKKRLKTSHATTTEKVEEITPESSN